METLIELYDERAIENVIGPETFRPSQIIYLCPPEVVQDPRKQEVLKDYFRHRGMKVRIGFVETSLYKPDRIVEQLLKIAEHYPDCVLDVTGGTDAAIFAAGMFCQRTGCPAFTYSRKRNRFYEINQAAFANEQACTLEYKVEDFFRMTGGSLRKGRVDNKILSRYEDSFDAFFEIYLKYRHKWSSQITFFQRISQTERGMDIPLRVTGSLRQKGEHGGTVTVDPELLKDLLSIGYLTDLKLPNPASDTSRTSPVSDTKAEATVSFTFKDHHIRYWLRDVGSVLELYMYHACRKTEIFNDVISSAVVDWDDAIGKELTTNEIDVMATRGVVPFFISCKATEVKTEALNELAILRDRFGGKGAKAAIATSEPIGAAARHRAAQLGIAVIDLEELAAGKAAYRLQVIMKAAPAGV